MYEDFKESTLAPDGSFRIEQEGADDERTGLWVTLRIVGMPGEQELASAINRGSKVGLQFATPGTVELLLTDATGQPRRVHIDPAARTLRFEPDGKPEALATLLDRLGWNAPPQPYVSPPRLPTPFARVFALLSMLVAGVFVAGGAWMALTAATPKDRWAGLIGVVFFGACAWSSLKSWRANDRR